MVQDILRVDIFSLSLQALAFFHLFCSSYISHLKKKNAVFIRPLMKVLCANDKFCKICKRDDVTIVGGASCLQKMGDWIKNTLQKVL